jgi:hypothetical protein
MASIAAAAPVLASAREAERRWQETGIAETIPAVAPDNRDVAMPLAEAIEIVSVEKGAATPVLIPQSSGFRSFGPAQGGPRTCGLQRHRPVWPSARAAARAVRDAHAIVKRASTSLRRVDTGLGNLAILRRGRARDANGPDDLAIHDDGNAALER